MRIFEAMLDDQHFSLEDGPKTAEISGNPQPKIALYRSSVQWSISDECEYQKMLLCALESFSSTKTGIRGSKDSHILYCEGQESLTEKNSFGAEAKHCKLLSDLIRTTRRYCLVKFQSRSAHRYLQEGLTQRCLFELLVTMLRVPRSTADVGVTIQKRRPK